jgi:hypothetical protein
MQTSVGAKLKYQGNSDFKSDAIRETSLFMRSYFQGLAGKIARRGTDFALNGTALYLRKQISFETEYAVMARGAGKVL